MIAGISWRRPGGSWLAVLFLAMLARSAAAQLPDAIVQTRSPLTPPQQATLNQFVDTQLAALAGEDETKVWNARRALVGPLDRNPSRTFSLVYEAALAPRLSDVLANPDASLSARVNAIHLLGALASDRSIGALESQLRVEDAAVRYAAAMAYERAFRAITAGGGAFTNPAQAEAAMARQLREAMEAESQSHPLHAQIAALTVSPSPVVAIDQLTAGLQAQLRRVHEQGPTARAERFDEALQGALTRFIRGLLATGQGAGPQREALVDTAVAAIMLALDHARDPGVASELRSAYADMVAAAENVLNVLTNVGAGAAGEDTTLSQAYRAGNVDEAERYLNEFWLVQDGPLRRAGLDVNPDRFRRLLSR